MKRYSLILILAACLALPAVPALSKVDFNVSPVIARQFGYTEYQLDIQGLVVAPTGDTLLRKARSLLKFPVDALIGGVSFTVMSAPTEKHPWSVEAGVLTNIGDPDGQMKDSDWDQVPGYYDLLWSYTESDAEMRSIILSLEITREMYRRNSLGVSLLAGFRYQRIKQTIDNYAGWQRQLDETTLQYSDPITFAVTNVPALTYEVKYGSPQVGLMARLGSQHRSSVSAKAVFAPVFTSDEDDHIQRNKISTASGNGPGIAAGFKAHLVTVGNGHTTPFVEIVGDLHSLTVSTSQTQRWYGDDPATPTFDDTGTVSTGIPHEIRSTQFSLGLRFGVGFY
jgi:hypothetical protein